MTPAGEIHIELTHSAGQVCSVAIVSTRPEAAARVLIGKTPVQVLQIVPLLFSLCGNAQAYAALSALRAALGLDAEPEADAARALLVDQETLREHAWRILMDWPGLLGLQPDKTSIAALLNIDRQFKPCLFGESEAFKLDSRLNVDPYQLNGLISKTAALIDNAIFSGGLREFLTLSEEGRLIGWLEQNAAVAAQLLNEIYQRGWQTLGRSEVACLPALADDDWHRQTLREDLSAFCRTPQWQGLCYESTPLNRQLAHPLIVELHSRYGNGLLVRFAAMLLEVAVCLQRLKRFGEPASMPASAYGDGGIGLAQVQAARGLLIHRLVLKQGRVYDYRIIAPTEWNFHPGGVVAQGLKDLPADGADSLRQQAQWLINAIDPCVAYRLILNER